MSCFEVEYSVFYHGSNVVETTYFTTIENAVDTLFTSFGDEYWDFRLEGIRMVELDWEAVEISATGEVFPLRISKR